MRWLPQAVSLATDGLDEHVAMEEVARQTPERDVTQVRQSVGDVTQVGGSQ